MAEALIARADRAFVDEEFDEAVDLYTQALALSPGLASIYDSRAHAQLKLENFVEAVEDASKAIELDPSLAKAFLRKGVASFKLEEYEAARDAFEAGAKLAPDNAQFATWIRKCQAEIDDEMEAPAEPAPPAPSKPAAASSPTSFLHPAGPPPPPTASTSAPAAAASAAAPSTPQGRYRHQHYQMQNRVTVDVFAKNLTKEQVSVTFLPQRLTVVIAEPAGSGLEDYKLDVELYGQIAPEQCRYEVLKTKLEITMVKANSNQQWASLEKSDRVAAPNYSDPAAQPAVIGQYPSSYHAKAPKDWGKVESEVKAMEEKGELGDGDPLNDFFKKIFSQGDEDQRRAMQKSFIESNGTVLSTNWKEVGVKKVECTPPDGMEVRKWSS